MAKSNKEIEIKLESLEMKDEKLSLIFQWVKSNVITKNQFFFAWDLIESQLDNRFPIDF